VAGRASGMIWSGNSCQFHDVEMASGQGPLGCGFHSELSIEHFTTTSLAKQAEGLQSEYPLFSAMVFPRNGFPLPWFLANGGSVAQENSQPCSMGVMLIFRKFRRPLTRNGQLFAIRPSGLSKLFGVTGLFFARLVLF